MSNIYSINSKEFFIGSKILEFKLGAKIIDNMPSAEGNKLSNILSRLVSKKYCAIVYNDIIKSRILKDEGVMYDPYIFIKAYLGEIYLQSKKMQQVDNIVAKFFKYLYDVHNPKNQLNDYGSLLEKYTQDKFGCMPYFVTQKLKSNKYKVALYIKSKYITSVEDASVSNGKKLIAKKVLEKGRF